jgi:hypothetical protein
MLSERRRGNEGIEIDLYQVMDVLACDTSRRANEPAENGGIPRFFTTLTRSILPADHYVFIKPPGEINTSFFWLASVLKRPSRVLPPENQATSAGIVIAT